MTRKEATEVLNKYSSWLKLGVEHGLSWEELNIALSMARQALNTAEQSKWERDVVMSQLADIGVCFGQKMDGVYLSKEEYEELVEYKHMYEGLTE